MLTREVLTQGIHFSNNSDSLSSLFRTGHRSILTIRAMNGQWIGTFSGTTVGSIVVNIDERRDYYEGTAVLIEGDTTLPDSFVSFQTANKDSKFQFRTGMILALDHQTGAPLTLEQLNNRLGKDQAFSRYADVSGSFDRESLTLSWITDTGIEGKCVLPRSKADQPSDLVPIENNWTQFKEYVSSLKGCRYLYRGQNARWRLRTSFHRTGRANLNRFLNEDMPTLHRHLSATTKHVFNLSVPDENGAFLNLIQHHGYPTPLLDWTYSPYVAAFFAYRGISNKKAAAADDKDKVRIYVFDQEKWRKDIGQIMFLVPPQLHVSIGEFIAIENTRMIPQQAASTVTNVDDIESYIRVREGTDKKYLWAIDLPVVDRQHVVRDLSYMGITAGSLFPGLDGACEELAMRNFEL